MTSLARWTFRGRWIVLILWVGLLVGMSVASRSAGSAYSDTFTLPGTDSVAAYQLLLKAAPAQAGDTDQVVFQSTSGSVTDPANRAIITDTLNKIAAIPGVANVTSPFCPTVAPCSHSRQISSNGTIAYGSFNFSKVAFRVPPEIVKKVLNVGTTTQTSKLHIAFGGQAIASAAQRKGSPDAIFGFLGAFVVLLIAFGSFFAMLLPIGVALVALSIASGATILLSHVVGIAEFSPILGSLIGAGVGIDYALFVVTRTRQGLKRGMSSEESVSNALNTSGRAVLFAGSTVVVALLGMFVLHLGYLNGVAISASLTVAIVMLASVTLLPALLAFIGPRVLSRKERRHLAANGPEGEVTAGGWLRWSQFVARHPVRLALVSGVAICALAVPYFSLHLGSADAGSDPAGSTTHQAYEYLSQGFGPGFNGPLQIVVPFTPGQATELGNFAAALHHVRGVVSTTPPIVLPYHVDGQQVALILATPAFSPQDQRTVDLINTIRHQLIPQYHLSAHIGGATAIFADFASVLKSKIPLFVGVIAFLGCLLLMIAFRSVLVPLTAAVMNLLAAAASFGVVVMVFQWGWGSSLLGAGTGPIESFLPVIMIAILFGLSMDYQVFLVSRMHEEWVATQDNETAVTNGQANTGRVITAAALIMICVFLSFVFGGQRVIAEFGVGLGGAVLLDAFILRTILVPALMHLFGRANWWMPAFLEKTLPHLAVEAHDEQPMI